MKRLVRFLFIAAFIGINVIGCGSDSNDATPDAILSSITGKVDDNNATIDIVDVAATSTGTGVQIVLSDTIDGAADTTVAADERQFKFKVIDLNQITDEVTNATPIDVGLTGNEIIVFDDETNHMLGSSGSITFTKLSSDVGGEIAFSFSVGFVGTSVQDPHDAQLTGSVTATVE